jgi:preprotein translocase SecE subunit
VADETRRQRRDARRAAGSANPAPAGVPSTVASPTPSAAPVPAPSEQRGGFVRESWAELRKVEWPSRAQVIQGTIVVLLACAIVGAYLWGVDQVLRPFVRDVLIG